MATSKNFSVRYEQEKDSSGSAVFAVDNLVATLTDTKTIEIHDSAGNCLQIQPKKNDGGIDSDWTSVDQGIAYFRADNGHEEG